MRVPFRKLHGLGNDDRYWDTHHHNLLSWAEWPMLAHPLCDRHRVVGADGMGSSIAVIARFTIRHVEGRPGEIDWPEVRTLGERAF